MHDDVTAVVVVCGERRVDVALPAHRPVAEFLANVVTLVAPEGGRHDAAWQLRRAGTADGLDAARTLDDHGVLDGDLLVLAGDGVYRPERRVDDAARALGAAVTVAAGPTRHRVVVSVALASAVAAVVAVVVRDQHAGAAATAVLAAVLLAATAAPGPVRRDRPASLVALAGALVSAAATGWSLTAGHAPGDRAAVATALVALAAGLPALWAVTLRAPLLLAGSAALGALAVTGPHWHGRARVAVTAVVALAAIALVAVAPRVGFAVARAGRLDRAPATVGAVHRVAGTGRLVVAACHGLAAGALVAAGAVLLRSPHPAAWLLAACGGVLLLLRTRSHRRLDELVPLVAGALGVLVTSEVVIGARHGWGWSALLLVLTALGVLASSVTAPRLRPLVRRRLAVADLVVAATSVVAALATTGWIGAAVRLGRG